MKNLEVADLLDKLGSLVEANGEDRFKVIAYHRAATSVRNMDEDVEEIWKAGKLEEIKFVGSGIAKKIDEYLGTGRLRLMDTLQAKIPTGVPELTKVQGVGPRTAYKLSHDLGITNVEELRKALVEGRLNDEFGETVRASMLTGIEKLKSYERRMLLPEAEGVFERLRRYYADNGVVVGMAGSLRRGKSTVGDLDVLSSDKRAIGLLGALPGVAQRLESGPRRASVKLVEGAQVDVRVFEKNEYGAALVYFTGSKDHNIALRNIALDKGMTLNEYRLARKTGERIAGSTEEEVYAKLGLEFVPPELRENRGEIEAAVEKRLPNLVRADQLKGDLQMHSTWSDGSEELRSMAASAKERGYEYIGITDHSVSVRVANGLTMERFRKQWKDVDRLNEELKPFRILKSVELEIKADGTLDFEDEFLKEFDMVAVSLHQSFNQSGEKITGRILRALSDPEVNLLCHPTNRLIGRREGNPIDLKKVIAAARDNGKMLEIDGQPDRLDLDDVWAKRAIEAGVTLSIDSDAHSTGGLDNVDYGVLVARRAWVESKNVLNTRGLNEVLKTVS
ncbi:MAG TPA: DNA polymerase/3'-5' exonuclease PolX [Nitrososphaerales archaeon]|nr:DNA polymerase/3'-5' exonuclease PolX [Nitrososphaerales archaeon]